MEFTVGLLGPSRAGKTSLLAAILHQVEEYCSAHNQYTFAPKDPETAAKIDICLNEFRDKYDDAQSNNGVFIGKVSPNTSMVEYSLSLKTPLLTEMEESIDIKFIDYPGGNILTTARADLLTRFLECEIMLVPIPSEQIYNCESLRGRMGDDATKIRVESRKNLGSDHVGRILKQWINLKINDKEKSFLSIQFVPVKCENCFYEGGVTFPPEKLKEYVRHNYFDSLELSDEQKQYLHVEYTAVDTYGIAVFAGSCVKDNLVLYNFRVRSNAPEDIKPYGCINVLVSALQSWLSLISLALCNKAAEKKALHDKLIEEWNNQSLLIKFLKNCFTFEKEGIEYIENEFKNLLGCSHLLYSTTEELKKLEDKLDSSRYDVFNHGIIPSVEDSLKVIFKEN